MSDKAKHLEMVRQAWDAYQPDYMKFHLLEWPRFYEHFAGGGTMLEPYLPEMLGDVRGLELLDMCCACDASMPFSWANLGARVTASDLSPEAIRIAKENATRIGLKVDFQVADAQTLAPFGDARFDVVFATYLVWFEDLSLACRNWHRVLRPGGRLLMRFQHPVTYWLELREDSQVPERQYQDTGPVYCDFDGTPLADRHGGWGRRVPCVEFHHTLAEILNAAVEAGFRLERTVEAAVEKDGPLSYLPNDIALLWRK